MHIRLLPNTIEGEASLSHNSTVRMRYKKRRQISMSVVTRNFHKRVCRNDSVFILTHPRGKKLLQFYLLLVQPMAFVWLSTMPEL